LDASASLTLVATVQAAGPLMNSARTTAQTEADPNPANDEASVSLNAGTTADVAVSKTISNPAPGVGAQVSFTVTVTNRGPSPATGVVVSDVLPAALTFVSATPSQGSYDATSGAWTAGDLDTTGSAVPALTALVAQQGPFTNTASRSNGNEPDPNPTNDSASATGTAGLLTDLSLEKTDGLTSASPGQQLTYTITVHNAGPSDAVG